MFIFQICFLDDPLANEELWFEYYLGKYSLQILTSFSIELSLSYFIAVF